MAKCILLLMLFFNQYSFAQIDPQNQYYKSGKLYSKRYLDNDSLFHFVKYYENGIIEEQLISKSQSFYDDYLISKNKYYSNGYIEQEETRTDSLNYIIYLKKVYNGYGKLRELNKNVWYNYNKIGDERPKLPPTISKKYYSNGQLESLIHGYVTSPLLEKQFYRNGQLKYYKNGEEKVIKEFYPDNSLKRLVSGDVYNISFENEFYENGILSKEKYIKNNVNIQKTYYKNGILKTEDHYSREKGQLLKTIYFEDGYLEYYENAEEQLTKEYHPNHKLKRIVNGNRQNPDLEKTFYENGNLRYEKYKENEITIKKYYHENSQLSNENHNRNEEAILYKNYYPSAQLSASYENVEEKIRKEFYEDGTLKKLTKGDGNNPDFEQEFYEDGIIKKEKIKSEKGTTIYKNYHPNGQLSYYDNEDERVKTQFFENGSIKSENYFDKYDYVYKVYDEQQNVINTNINSLKYPKTVSQDPNYDFEQKLANGLTIVEKNDKYGILNKKGKVTVPVEYDFIHFDVENTFEMKYSVGEIRKDGKDGLVNDKGKIIVPLKYDRIDISNNGTYYTVRKTNGEYKYGLINKNGTATRAKFDGINSYEDIDYAIAERNEKYGLFSNINGKKLAPIIYDDINVVEYSLKETEDIEEEIAIVERKNKNGLISLKGKKLTPIKFFKIEDHFEYGLAICTFSLVNPVPVLSKDWLIRSIYETENMRVGVVNLKGKEVLPFKYKLIRLEGDKDFSYLRVWAYQKDSYRFNEHEGIYSLEGKEIVPSVFDRADQVDAKNNLIRVEKKQFHGMYDLKGNEFIPAKYDQINYYTNELFMVKKDGLYGFLDHKGKTIFLPQYTEDQVKTIANDFFILTDDTNETWKNVKEFQKN